MAVGIAQDGAGGGLDLGRSAAHADIEGKKITSGNSSMTRRWASNQTSESK